MAVKGDAVVVVVVVFEVEIVAEPVAVEVVVEPEVAVLPATQEPEPLEDVVM
ncbi:hypothetical protein SAMD00019534_075200 [Acytostelium subglobosum LB1]|uniref:hypothetical protein n=1 Tax=Acytostelium subglobosum LB1 TaxID=1410327 RepID=UPI000644EF59|nr:hypothetical protein SAMD00019534_075200 [Acytostelium subglobosum LB1]GAM24345.1 hypothetical protein SAMD00019534_075200 [Acytostelium subglobosum LB1]|eukprot:XP_012752671.1 hypothetical protein SAMD00019534_075200 [Acytostelium subglobosum LB1]